MNQRRKNAPARRRAVTWALIAPAFTLLSACADSVGVEVQQGLFLEEMFDFTVENDIQYGSAPDEDGVEQALLLDLFEPTGDIGHLRPAIVWLHGGSYQQGDKEEMEEFARRFALRGYVSVSANYRLRENAVFDYTDPDDPLAEPVKRDAQHDAQAAVRWLRAKADEHRIDPNLIFVAGYSAGGTAALRVAARPDDPGDSGNPGESSSVVAAVAIAGSLEPGILEAAAGPTLLIHGEADTKVPFAEVEAACSAVERCRLVPIPLGEHSLIGLAMEEIISETAVFLQAEVTS